MAKKVVAQIDIQAKDNASAEVKRAMNNLKSELRSMEGVSKKATTGMKFGFNLYTVAIAAAATAIVAAGAAIHKTIGFIKDSVSLSNVQIEAETKLAAVIKSTGGAAGKSLESMKAYASQLQSITTIGDEVILGGMSILATFKNIKGQAFDQATKAALDLSAVMGQDLKSSMVQIGKALNDPIQGMTALSRVGVTFTDSQKDMVKQLVDSGDVMGAQKIILQELQSEFGGTAEALRQTFKGAVDSVGNSFGDLKEKIGNIITQNPAVIALTNKLTSVFDGLSSGIVQSQGSMMNLVKYGIVYLLKGFKLAGKQVIMFGVAFQSLKFGFSSIKIAMNEFSKSIAEMIIKLINQINEMIFTINSKLPKSKRLSIIPPEAIIGIDQYIMAVNDVIDKEKERSDKIKNSFISVAETYASFESGVDTLIDKINNIDATKAVDNAKKLGALKPGNIVTEYNINKSSEYKKAQEKIEEENKRFSDRTSKYFADSFSNSFNEILEHSKSFGDSMKDLFTNIVVDIRNNIINNLFKDLFKNILTSMNITASSGGGTWISSLFGSAHGNAFNNGNVIPLAHGGILSSPTLFPMARGMGLAGEAGPEAVMPLKRDSSGDLGVNVSGQSPSVINNNYYSIQTMDAESFSGYMAKNAGAVVNALGQQANYGDSRLRSIIQRMR